MRNFAITLCRKKIGNIEKNEKKYPPPNKTKTNKQEANFFFIQNIRAIAMLTDKTYSTKIATYL